LSALRVTLVGRSAQFSIIASAAMPLTIAIGGGQAGVDNETEAVPHLRLTA
jgi:hypothetical protein